MSEVNEGDQSNMWLSPPSRTGGARPPEPRGPSDPEAEETSASARALAEGWPAQPGWMPEGAAGWPTAGDGPSAGPTQSPGQQYSGQQYSGQQYSGQGWIPSQSAHPTIPGPPQSGPGGVPPAPYPGPPGPLPRPNTGKVVGIIVGVVVLVAAAVTAGLVLSRRGSDTPGSVASAPAGSTGGTTSGGTDPGRSQTSSGTSGSTGGSGSSGTGSGSTTTPRTGTSGAGAPDLTTVTLGSSVTGADAADIALTLDAYFTGINGSDYRTAWNQLSPSQQAKNPLGEFTDATSGTIDRDVRLNAATPNSDGTARASVAFTSTQPGDKGVNPGETCTDWSITYTLVRGSGAGGWVISDTPAAQHSAC